MNDFKSRGDKGEEYVNELSYKSYLKYWCYPNPTDITGDKKEICDLLILFRDIAIIISVKNHYFEGNYEKYKRKVVEKSTKQLNGAYRKLFTKNREIKVKHPNREEEIFSSEKYKHVFRITINVGEQFEHYELCDQIENKGFINILNKDTFETIIHELDTIKDLVDYLKVREKLLLSQKVINFNCQEKDLLAVYLTNARNLPFDFDTNKIKKINLDLEGAWENYDKSEAAKQKRLQDEKSYFIDRLVKTDILKLPYGEILARELMNLGRLERRMITKTLFNLVARHENNDDAFARIYTEYNGIGHLLIYYPPNQKEEQIDWVIQRAMEIYSYKTNFREKEIIALAATKGLKQWKFGMFKAKPPISDNSKKYLDNLISQFGWFKETKAYYYEEKEYPTEE